MLRRGWILGAFALLFLVGCDILPNRQPAGPVEIDRPDYFGVADPTTGEVGVPLDGKITFEFSERVDPSTAYGAISILHEDQPAVGTYSQGAEIVVDSTIADTVTSGSDTSYTYTYTKHDMLDFTPTTPYIASAVYNVVVHGDIRDLNRNSLSIDTSFADSSWFFTSGDYNDGGWYTVYAADKLDNSLLTTSAFDSAEVQVNGLTTPSDIVVSPNGQYVAVSNKTSAGYIALFDNTLNSETDVPVDVGPEDMAIDDEFVYVVNTSANTISSVDLASGVEADRLTFSDGFDPERIALDSDGGRLLITSASNNAPGLVKIVNISGGNLSEATTIDLLDNAPDMNRKPASIVISGDEAFILQDLSNNVYVISTTGEYLDTFNFQVTVPGDTVASGDQGRGMWAYGDKGYIYTLDKYFYQVDLPSRQIIQYTTLSNQAWDVKFTPQGDLIFVAIAADENITVIEPGYMKILGTEKTTSGSRAIAVGRVK